MTLEQLLYYSEVYRQRSITHACENLHLTQQCLSSAIKQLEKEFSSVFFIRSRNGVVPTNDGDIFYNTAQTIIHEYITCLHKVSGNAKPDACTIGIAHVFSSKLSSSLFHLLKEIFPDINFKFSAISYNDTLSLSYKNYPDILFTFVDDGPEDIILPDGFSIRYIFSYAAKDGLWIAKRSPLAQHKQLSLHHLKDTNFCLLKNQSDRLSLIDRFKPLDFSEREIYTALNSDILTDIIKNDFYVMHDVYVNNTTLVCPEFFNDKELVFKFLPKDFQSTYLAIIFRDDYYLLYPIIADFLSKAFEA